MEEFGRKSRQASERAAGFEQLGQVDACCAHCCAGGAKKAGKGSKSCLAGSLQARQHLEENTVNVSQNGNPEVLLTAVIAKV